MHLTRACLKFAQAVISCRTRISNGKFVSALTAFLSLDFSHGITLRISELSTNPTDPLTGQPPPPKTFCRLVRSGPQGDPYCGPAFRAANAGEAVSAMARTAARIAFNVYSVLENENPDHPWRSLKHGSRCELVASYQDHQYDGCSYEEPGLPSIPIHVSQMRIEVAGSRSEPRSPA